MPDDIASEAIKYITDRFPPGVDHVSSYHDRFHNRIKIAYRGNWEYHDQVYLGQEVTEKFGLDVNFNALK